MATKLQLAYIAGLFDGEGCVHGQIPSSGFPKVRITIGQKRPEILHWTKELLGMGKVHSHNGFSSWAIWDRIDIEKFIDLILPYCRIKKEELVIGKKLVSLMSPKGTRFNLHRQERIKLCNQLKLLKGA